jgi:hypothetical protein
MELGIISPPNMLRKYSGRFPLQYCYCTVAARSPYYLKYYAEQQKKGRTVILEWSPELPRSLGRGYNRKLFEHIIQVLNPTRIVLPSRDFGATDTVREAHNLQSSPVWETYKDKCIGLMQGANSKELQECYTDFVRTLGVTSIGLASPLELLGPRNLLLETLSPAPQYTCEVFFIETYKDFYTEFPPLWVKGFCTSYPIRLGLEKRPLAEDTSKIPAPLTFEKEADSAAIEENISELERWLP